MKRVVTLFVLLAGMSISAAAQTIEQSPTITVNGTAEIMIAPDEVVFSIDVTKIDKELPIAKRANDEVVAKVLELCRRYSILPKDVKTDNISVDMKYVSVRDPKNRIYDEDGDEIGTRQFRGYEISKTITVRLRSIDRFEEFFGDVLKTGISEVNSIRFETSKLRENKDTARDLAMRAAREKAVAMAASVQQTIGKAIRISESGVSNPTYSSNISANSTAPFGSFSEGVASFAPGAIKVEALVTVTFILN